jgi:hypothetical protein
MKSKNLLETQFDSRTMTVKADYKGWEALQIPSPFNSMNVLFFPDTLTHQLLEFLCRQRLIVNANVVNQAGP